MAAENLKSTPITNLDAQPVVVATSGEGAPGYLKKATDFVNPATFTTAATYRLARFPTNAKVKKVQLYLSGIEAGAGTANAATIDINVAFSDSTVDGTPAALQGAIPSSILDGTAYAFVTGTGYSTQYSSTGTGNKMFGSALALGNSTTTAFAVKDLTFLNTYTASMREDDLWDALGFKNAQGLAQDPGGFFDMFVVAAHAAGSATAGQILIEVDFVI